MPSIQALSYKSGFYSKKRGGIPKHTKLSRNLVYASYPAMGETGLNLFNVLGGFCVHGGSWVRSYGYSAIYNHTSPSLGSTYLPISGSKAPFSIFAWVVRTNVSEAGIIDQSIPAEANRMSLSVGNNVRYSHAGAGDLFSVSTSSSGDMLNLIISDNCITAKMFVNGKFENSQSGSGQCSDTPTTLNLTRDLNLLGLCLWNGYALNENDAILLQSDPFAPLRLARNRSVNAPSSTGNRRRRLICGAPT